MFQNDDDDDDQSADEMLSKQVLPINDDQFGPVDLNKMPTTGEEYLRQVRYQASQLPDFQTASQSKKRVASSSSAKKPAWHRLFAAESNETSANAHQVPLDWQNQQCTAFSNVRQDFFPTRDRLRKATKDAQTPKLKAANHFWKFCFGEEIPYQSSLAAIEEKDDTWSEQCLPTLTKISRLTQPQLHQLLQYEMDWLKQNPHSTQLALYMYATLVAVEKPIDEDTIFTMRQVCQVWKQIRMEVLNSSPSIVKTCDLFVCLIARYFGQFDLADMSDQP